jgi:hypothetical protein
MAFSRLAMDDERPMLRMAYSGFWRWGGVPLVALAVALVIPAIAHAQKKSRTIGCAQATDPALRVAGDKALLDLDQLALSVGADRFVAFSTQTVKTSPFALPQHKALGDAAAIAGFAWIRRPTCRIEAGATSAVLRIEAGAVRFYETGQGWSAPMTGGLLAVVLATKTGAVWDTQTPGDAQTMFLPGARLSQPQIDALPARDEWPDRGCDTLKAWDSDRCVGLRAKLIR